MCAMHSVDPLKASEICKLSFQHLLHTQTPWGEWGKGYRVKKDRGADVGRADVDSFERFFTKPHMYRTLSAIQLMDAYGLRERYAQRAALAWDWIGKHFDGIYFRAWQFGPGVEHETEHETFQTINKIFDIRHTTQALLFSLLFRGYSEALVRGLEEILDCQDKKTSGWPLMPGTDPEVIATAYAAELLFRFPFEKLQDGSSLHGRVHSRELESRAKESALRGIRWINQCAKQGGKKDIHKMSHALYRLGPLLEGNDQVYLAETILNHVSKPEFADSLTYGELAIYAVGLTVAKRIGVDYYKQCYNYVLSKLIDEFEFRNLDTPQYIWLLEIFKDHPEINDAVRACLYGDYLFREDHKGARADDSIDNVLFLLTQWLSESVYRMQNLERGRRKGITGYELVYTYEREKVERMLDKIGELKADETIDQLLLITRKAIVTSDSRYLDERFKEKVFDDLENIIPRTSRFRKVYEESKKRGPDLIVQGASSFLVDLLKKLLIP